MVDPGGITGIHYRRKLQRQFGKSSNDPGSPNLMMGLTGRLGGKKRGNCGGKMGEKSMFLSSARKILCHIICSGLLTR